MIYHVEYWKYIGINGDYYEDEIYVHEEFLLEKEAWQRYHQLKSDETISFVYYPSKEKRINNYEQISLF